MASVSVVLFPTEQKQFIKWQQGTFVFTVGICSICRTARTKGGGGGPGKDIVACVANEQRANGHLAWPVQHRTEAGFN